MVINEVYNFLAPFYIKVNRIDKAKIFIKRAN